MFTKLKLLLFLLLLLLLSCNNKPTIVNAKIEAVHTKPWPRSGNILYYTITYEYKGAIDTATLYGNGVYKKGTVIPVVLSAGDSVKVKTKGNKRIRAKNIVSFVKKDNKEQKKVIKQSNMNASKSINRVDSIPVLPGSTSIQDNESILSSFFFKRIKDNNIEIDERFVVYIRIDTIGNTLIEKIYNNNPHIVSIIEEGVYELPLFTPAIDRGRKVSIITSFEIKP